MAADRLLPGQPTWKRISSALDQHESTKVVVSARVAMAWHAFLYRQGHARLDIEAGHALDLVSSWTDGACARIHMCARKQSKTGERRSDQTQTGSQKQIQTHTQQCHEHGTRTWHARTMLHHA